MAVHDHADSGYLTLLLPSMIVMALGLGFVFVPITLTAVSGVEKRDSGIASAMLNVTQQIGGTIGLAVLVTVFATAAITRDFTAGVAAVARASGSPTAAQLQQLKAHSLAYGFGTAFKAAVVFAAIALIAAVFGLRSGPVHGKPVEEVVPAAG